jgi:hypothetical protein
MKQWSKKFEKLMAAATFAEAGEHSTALRMLGEKPVSVDWAGGFARIMNAVTFAEADCHDMARAFLDTPSRAGAKPRNEALEDFIFAVGLEKATFRYGLATA